jgi:predicted Zn-dependent protease
MRAFLLVAVAASLAAQDREAALGEHVAAQMRKDTTPADPSVREYVEALAKRLAPPDSHWEIDVVVEDLGWKTYEPVWVPGHLFVPARLVLSTRSEAELAGLLAHAMSHVARRTAGGTIYLGNAAPLDSGMEAGTDERAVRLLAAAGYDPRALIDYLRRLEPSPATRIVSLEDAVAGIPPRAEWVESSGGFVEAQERLRRSLAARPPRKPSLFRDDR